MSLKHHIHICHCDTAQHVLYIAMSSQHSNNNINMQAEEYWLMAREYGIWNAAIAALQFWTEDLAPATLGRSL